MRRKIILLFTFLIFVHLSIKGQSKINAPLDECISNLINFTYTPPSGLTLSSANWSFGNGSNSSVNSPNYTYANPGVFTVIINASFTNGSSKIDSTIINIHALPSAKMYFKADSDTCLSRNSLCYFDTSMAANINQTIKQRLIVWGDGTFDNSTNPKRNDLLCHTYLVPDKYNLKLEITDTFGCKSSFNTIKSVADNIVPSFDDSLHFFDCNTAQICVRNKSIGATPATEHFRWYVNGVLADTGKHFNSQKCFYFTQTQKANIRLIAYANSDCRDTFELYKNVTVDSLPTFIVLADTLRCFGDETLAEASTRMVSCDKIEWSLNNQVIIPLPHVFTKFFGAQIMPGVHTVKAEIFRGNCVHTITAQFRVIGPVASIQAIDDKQCFSNRQVFFVEKSIGNKNNQKYHWYIHGQSGNNCINYRQKGINLNQNCTQSLDWYTKYKYPNNSGNANLVSLVVTDTVTGCKDSVTKDVDMKYCSKILDPDTLVVCQGEIFLNNLPLPYPKYFTIDSGRNWIKYPGVMNAPYEGFYDVGFIFETKLIDWAENFGNDSIKLHNDTIEYYDTIYKKQLLFVVPLKKDSIKVNVYNTCNPFRVSLTLQKGQFYKGEKLYVVWGDNGNIEIDFNKDTAIDSIIHYYRVSGFSSEIQVFITNINGCVTRFKFPVQRGKAMSKSTPKFINCLYDKVCFYPGVYEFKTNSFWSQNTPNNKVQWKFPDTNGLVNEFQPCIKYKYGGLRPFEMIVTDSFGCRDTLRDSVFIQDVRANVKLSAKIVYCSELKQFYDSSSFLLNPLNRLIPPFNYLDSIKKYSWQFGDGTFSSLNKNPLQALNTSLDKIKASHAVETFSGCKDTFRFEIDVIGPKPYFLIKDTIGCGSLNAEFINLSKNCKEYIWQYGDSANTNFQTNSKGNVTFNYTKPGRYFISLIGIDTVFNPLTNKYQACLNTFPDKLFQKDTQRSVLVLPLLATGIESIDTICVNQNILFSSNSDPAYNRETWSFGDSANIKVDTISPSNVSYYYSKKGAYTIKLNPYYSDSLKNMCLDSTSKTIYVVGVDAQFSLDNATEPPQFIFKNESDPLSANMFWDFDHLNSSSTELNPSYNYQRDTGTFNVCLIAKIPFGCADTFCLPVTNHYLADFQIFNVFTPGNSDSKNDEFDIIIEGESYYHLKIFDRWGVSVYEAFTDSENGTQSNWNGKVNNTGADCSSGTYYYIFEYALENKDVNNVLSGVITLIR